MFVSVKKYAELIKENEEIKANLKQISDEYSRAKMRFNSEVYKQAEELYEQWKKQFRSLEDEQNQAERELELERAKNAAMIEIARAIGGKSCQQIQD